MMNEARKRLIFALDVDSFETAQKWVERLHKQVGLFKIGKQLFTRCGPRVVEMVRESGGDVFLDLKYHDIPNTVAKAGIEACRLGVSMFNVHALGGAKMMQQTVAPRLAKIVTVSEASRAAIEKYFKISEKDVSVVYNGTDTEIFKPLPEVEKEADLLFVGRTEERKKGIGTMFEALSMLPDHVTLKIVDGRIPRDGLVPKLIARFGLQGRVSIIDRMLTVPELVEQYSTAKVAIVPSFFEGFGFPASEAMACGLSVIANAAGALPEVIGTNGRSGRLVPPRNARATADAMWDILRNPAETQRMGIAAR
ncbi:MAG: glycosyltransferase, partial [Geopsychrobacter sp.]|nr:glycosyltransferase [Geopsychrobacter sp.]